MIRKDGLTSALILALSASALVVMPFAQADYADPKTTEFEISVDGNSFGLASSVTTRDGVVLSGAFGGGGYSNDSSESELTKLYPSNQGQEIYLVAQGGVVATNCSGGGVSYSQRARITITNLPASAKDVWVFYDAKVGSGDLVKTFPHFNDQGIDSSGSPIANVRISDSNEIQTLCDGSTQYVSGTAGTLVLGAGANVRTTSGVVVNDTSATSVTFDAYVPMDGSSDGEVSIFLALGVVVDVGGDGVLDDTSTDVGIEAWVASEPFWPEPGVHEDETHFLLETCDGSENASANPCVESDSGVFASNGTTRAHSTYSVQLELIGEADNLEANLELAPTAAIGSSGFAIPAGSIVKMKISWPSSGNLFGAGAFPVGTGEGQINFALVNGDTAILVDPSTTAVSSNTNRWDIASGDRVVTTLVGEARAMSSAISRTTWWPQCSVSLQDGSVTSDKCGADMNNAVTSDFMVFDEVPAYLNLVASPSMSAVAGGLVSTNGQGFSFGNRTFDGDGYEFVVSGPSFNASNQARSTDGFYYVCIPGGWLSGAFSITPAEAADQWRGLRDGAVTSETGFVTGTCGTGESGLVASLTQFGYSSPVFLLEPTPPAAAPAPPQAPRAYSGPAPTGISSKVAYAGDLITIIGRRLNLVGSIAIDGVKATISAQSTTALVFEMPASLKAGTKLIVFGSSQGTLTYYSGLIYVEKAVTPEVPIETGASESETAATSSGKVNAGAFNGYVAVYAKGHKGKTLSWKIAGKWFKTTVASDYQVFQRKTAAVGLNVGVDIYIDGVKQLTKTVLTR
ncbi:MAG: IPT/TIG domain-containing protein [Actinomycetota bacterium]|nr:IPT/TIG domain-containing protein [Actinomycetota bacterium]